MHVTEALVEATAPASHGEHSVASKAALVPAIHSTHLDAELVYTVPGAHGVQATEPGSLNPEPHSGHLSTLPREKWFAPHCFSPTRSNVLGSSVTSCPACTVWQNVAFASVLYVPSVHGEHAVAPDSDEYEPFVHGVQVAPSKYSPGVHCLQYVDPAESPEIPPSSAQRRHESIFVAFVNSPSPQRRHSESEIDVHGD